MTTTELSPAYERKMQRLVALSADGYDAFEDVDWETHLDPEDPRLALFDFDPLARTRWYQLLPEPRKAEVGLLRMATNLRIGWEFENLLQQGLLAHAFGMRNTNASFRYLAIPAVLALMAPLMVNPSPWLVNHYDIPKKDLAQALAHPEARQLLADSVARIRTVCKQQGLLTREATPLWKRAGLWGA